MSLGRGDRDATTDAPANRVAGLRAGLLIPCFLGTLIAGSGTTGVAVPTGIRA